MTRKDFEGLAAILKALKPAWNDYALTYNGAAKLWKETAIELASWCATQNPRFDRTRFLKACGLEG